MGGISDQRRHEIEHEHLLVRLPLTIGGAALALVGSFLAWSSGLTDSTGSITRGGIGGDGKYTALLALAAIGCTAWFAVRPERRPAIAAGAASGLLLLVSIVEWNSVSDAVETANRENGLFATASVSAGIWVLLLGSVLTFAGAVWTARVDR
ncbi:MAG: hypothetical protein QOG33_216 [Gaiellales bacterium]|nr:hypothetical protein [Gaiellales bacterium]